MLYLHGGGMIFGLEHIGEMYDVAVREYVATSGVPMLVVDYRVAPEHPHPTPVEDCPDAFGAGPNARCVGSPRTHRRSASIQPGLR